MNNTIDLALFEIVDYVVITERDGEPMDDDAVDDLVEHLRNKINLYQGNITSREYEELEGRKNNG